MERGIVVGIDFADASLEALRAAREWALGLEVPVVLVHVYGPAAVGPGGMVPAPMWAGVQQSGRVLAAGARERLSRLGDAELEDVAHEAVVVEHVSAARAICTVAEETGAELVVVGTHGRRGLDRLLLGSVAQQVVRRAPCAVLVVPAEPPERRAHSRSAAVRKTSR